MGLLVFVLFVVAFITLMNPIIQGCVNANVYGFTYQGAFMGYEVKTKGRVIYVSRPVNWLNPFGSVHPQAVFWFGGDDKQYLETAQRMAEKRYIIDTENDSYDKMTELDKQKCILALHAGRKVWPNEDVAELMDDEANGYWYGKDDTQAKKPDLKLV